MSQAPQSVAERTRRVNLETLSLDEVDAMSKAIGDKVAAKMNATAEDIKKILAIYGLDIKLTYILHPIGENPLDQLTKEQETLKKSKPVTKKPRAKKAKA